MDYTNFTYVYETHGEERNNDDGGNDDDRCTGSGVPIPLLGH